MEATTTSMALMLHGIPVIGVLILAVAMHYFTNNNNIVAMQSLATKLSPVLRHRLLTAVFLVFVVSALGLVVSIRARWSHIDDIPIVGAHGDSSHRTQPAAPPKLPAFGATYGGTPLYSPYSVVANANYSCFDGTTPLSCAAYFCNMSTTITDAYLTHSCDKTTTASINYVTSVAAVKKKTCVQSTNARCTTAALTALFGAFPGVFAAYCTDSFLVYLSSGKSRTQSYNLENIPFPPGGTDSTGACRTRSATITDEFTEAGIPLVTVALPTAAYTNNKNTNVWPLGANDKGGWMKDGNSLEWGIPTDGNVGYTLTGQQIYPVHNNNGGFTVEKCEVDACNSHVGGGGGPPHLHGDPFGPSCLYSAANYTPTLDVHPPMIGFSIDGYIIYGRYLTTSAVGASTTIDLCGGHEHDSYGYHYHTQVLTTTSGSTGLTLYQNITTGLSYVYSTTGPYYCFKGDLLASDSYFGSIKGPTLDNKTAFCEGMTNYYLQPGYTLNGAGTQAVAASTPSPSPTTTNSGTGSKTGSGSGTVTTSPSRSSGSSPESTPASTLSPSPTTTGSGTNSKTGSSSVTLTPTATPSSSSTSPAKSTVDASFTLSELPLSAYNGSVLSTTAVTTVLNALTSAVTSSSGCANCTVTLTKITDAQNIVVYSNPNSPLKRRRSLVALAASSLRVLSGALTIDYTVTGDSASVAAVTTSATTSFSNSITAGISTTYVGVTATVIVSTTPTAAAASKTTDVGAVVGGVIGGIILVIFIIISVWYRLKLRASAGANARLTKSSKTNPAADPHPDASISNPASHAVPHHPVR